MSDSDGGYCKRLHVHQRMSCILKLLVNSNLFTVPMADSLLGAVSFEDALVGDAEQISTIEADCAYSGNNEWTIEADGSMLR